MGRIAPTVLLLMLLPASARGQDQPTTSTDTATATLTEPAIVTKDPAGLAVAQRAISAMGGQGQSLSDSQATGTLTMAGDKPQSFPVVLKTKGTRMVRVELQRDSGITVRILNQGRGVIQRPDGTVQRLVMNNTLAERVSHIPALSLLAETQDATVPVEYAGTAQVNAAPADVVALSVIPASDPQQARVFHDQTRTLFFLDQGSGLVTKVQYTQVAENDTDAKQAVEVLFSDYRNVNGVWVPFRQATYTDGKLESELVLDTVTFNVGLADEEFSLPQ